MARGGAGRPQGIGKSGAGYRLSSWLNENMDNMTSMTNEEIAEKLGYVRPNIISMWRTGRTRIPLDRLDGLAAILGVDVTFLLPLWLDQYASGNSYAKLVKVFSRLVGEDELQLISVVREITKGRHFNLKSDAKKQLTGIIQVQK